MAHKTHVGVTIYVAGRGRFPVDMLRYDSCVPSSQADVYAMGIYLDGTAKAPRIVALRMFTEDGRPPEFDRWHSFGWQVLTSAEANRIRMSDDPPAELGRVLDARWSASDGNSNAPRTLSAAAARIRRRSLRVPARESYPVHTRKGGK